MLQHRSKSYMHRMILALVMLLLFVGRISALDETKTSSTDVNDSDYDSEDVDDQSPGEQVKPAGPQPYFKQGERKLSLEPKNKTKIDCPVEGFDDTSHSIIWYKNNKAITNGNHSMSNEYQVVGKFSLLIENFTKDTPGTYMCQIIPGNITQITLLQIKNKADNHLENGFFITVMMIALITYTPKIYCRC